MTWLFFSCAALYLTLGTVNMSSRNFINGGSLFFLFAVNAITYPTASKSESGCSLSATTRIDSCALDLTLGTVKNVSTNFVYESSVIFYLQ